MFNFLNILGNVIHTLIVNWAFDLRCSLVRGGSAFSRENNLEVPVKLSSIILYYCYLQYSRNFIFFVLRAFSALYLQQGRYSLGGVDCVDCCNRVVFSVFASCSKSWETILFE